MDFTIKYARSLFKHFLSKGYNYQTFSEFLRRPEDRTIMLRHDVDLRPKNSLWFAKLQHELGIKGTYYFRAVPQSWNENIIREIATLGHEVGYHYENLSTFRGNKEAAVKDFEINLTRLRNIVPVSTICMHGSPTSSHNNRDLWKHYNYHDFGIIGEPYFDVDFTKVLYLTDTGRRWDGEKVSVRDKIEINGNDNINLVSYHTTKDIIKSAEANMLPQKIMFTFHPQRWTDKPLPWIKELFMQNLKNIIKRGLIAIKKS